MKTVQLVSNTLAMAFAAALTLEFLASEASAGPPPRSNWSIGVNIGGPPVYRPYPYYRPHYHYHYPHYYYVEPRPVIIEPAPVVIQQPVVVTQPRQTIVAQPQPTTTFEATPTMQTVNATAADAHLNNLRHPDEAVRRNSVLELGRMKAYQAVQPLTATLAGDQSPSVREAAARALGLIGSPQALTALTHAGQADTDRDVRHSAICGRCHSDQSTITSGSVLNAVSRMFSRQTPACAPHEIWEGVPSPWFNFPGGSSAVESFHDLSI